MTKQLPEDYSEVLNNCLNLKPPVLQGRPDLNSLTVQQLCDWVVQQLVRQGARCRSRYGSTVACAYDDRQGNHCAIGWLMADHAAEPVRHFEGALPSLMSFLTNNNMQDALPDVVYSQPQVFAELQMFHDAGSVSMRAGVRRSLSRQGIDTDADHWHQWIDLADEPAKSAAAAEMFV